MVSKIKLHTLTTREIAQNRKKAISYSLVGSDKELIWNRRIRITCWSCGWLIIAWIIGKLNLPT